MDDFTIKELRQLTIFVQDEIRKCNKENGIVNQNKVKNLNLLNRKLEDEINRKAIIQDIEKRIKR